MTMSYEKILHIVLLIVPHIEMNYPNFSLVITVSGGFQTTGIS